MYLITIILFLISGLEGDAGHSDSQTLKISLSKASSIDKIMSAQSEANGLGFDIKIQDISFDDAGALESYTTEINMSCDGEDYKIVRETILKNSEEVGIIFIGKECQHGVMQSQSNNHNLNTIFFGAHGPDHLFLTW